MEKETRDLYQEMILDHYKNPRNKGRFEGINREADGHNPLCGDRVKVYLEVEGDHVKRAGFEGSGCAISTASASMMTDLLKGKSKEEIGELFRMFHRLVTGENPQNSEGASLGKLAVFSGVSEFPLRVKCATLAWHTLNAALENSGQTISTEMS